MVSERPTHGLAVDAAHSMKNGRTQIQGVDIATGQQVFYQDLGNLTVNIGEFLAIVEGIKFLVRTKDTTPIVYSDSLTALRWVRNKATASRKRSRQVQKAEIFLKACDAQIKHVTLQHWDNKTYGETPADFGNK